jgi:hypothetical protein
MTNCNRKTRAPLDDGATERSMSAQSEDFTPSRRDLRTSTATSLAKALPRSASAPSGDRADDASVRGRSLRYSRALRCFSMQTAKLEPSASKDRSSECKPECHGARDVSFACGPTDGTPARDPKVPFVAPSGGNQSRYHIPQRIGGMAVAKYLDATVIRRLLRTSNETVRTRGKSTR